MATKDYKCIVEVTTRPQPAGRFSGQRLTFRPGDIIEGKFLRGQTVRLLDMKVIEEIKKTRTKTTTSDTDIESVDGS